jgi:MFS family permease
VTESWPTSASVTVEQPDDVSIRRGMFATLRVREFLRLYVGSTIVFLGVMGQGIARGWLAFDLTGSNAALGGVLLAFGVAMLVVTPWGGVVADRMPKRLILQVSIGLLAATSAWIGLAVAFNVVAYWMLLAAGALQAVAFALYNPARMAFISELVPSRDVPEAVTLLLINAEASRVAGPALAGVVIASSSSGTQGVFIVCATLFVGALLVTCGLPVGRRHSQTPPRSPLAEMVDGLRYVRRRQELMTLLWCILLVVMIGLPYLAFLPTVAADLFGTGSAGYGVLSASSAAGAVVVGFLVGPLRRRVNPWKLLSAAGMLFGVALVVLGLAPSFAFAVAVLVPLGAGMLVVQTIGQSMLMSLSDLEFHGRIQGLVMLGFGGFGIAALPLGLLADAFGLRLTVCGMGAAVVLTVIAFVVASRSDWSQVTLRNLG